METLDTILKTAQIAALVFAAAVVIYYFVTAQKATNLSTALHLTRSPDNANDCDHLAVSANLRKGGRGTLLLTCVEVWITWTPDGELAPELDIVRLAHDGPERTKQFSKAGQTPDPEQRFLRLAADEETNFACLASVPRDTPCTVDLVVLTEIEGWDMLRKTAEDRVGQWRASAVSLPPA